MNHNKHEYIEKIKTNESIVNNLGDKFQIFILLFLLVIFIHSTNFFQNFAKVLKSNDAKRIEVVYGFCSPKGVGYINYLKKNIDFNLTQIFYITHFTLDLIGLSLTSIKEIFLQMS